jgi:hypothetical protein
MFVALLKIFKKIHLKPKFMKPIALLFLFIFFHLFSYSQKEKPPKQAFGNPPPYERPTMWDSNSITYPTPSGYISPEYTPCQPVRGIDYTESLRTPMQPFNFHKLRFETYYGYYLKITLEIFASGNSIVNIEDEYYAQTTNINSAMDRKEFTDILFILARCDYDSFVEEKVKNNLKCCNSFFEVSFNDEIKRCRGCAFSPFNNRELESALWHFIVFKAQHALDAPNIPY